jgi:hypothetical protein
MAEHQKLRSRGNGEGSPNRANVIAAMALLDELDKSSPEQPFVREKTSAAVGVVFFEARRLNKRELAQGVHHPRELFAKAREESLRESLRECLLSHNDQMLATPRAQGNRSEKGAASRTEQRWVLMDFSVSNLLQFLAADSSIVCPLPSRAYALHKNGKSLAAGGTM